MDGKAALDEAIHVRVEVQQAAGLYADWATYDLHIDSNAESEQVGDPCWNALQALDKVQCADSDHNETSVLCLIVAERSII